MAVLGGLEVDWLCQVKLLHDHTWTEIEVAFDDSNELVGREGGGSVRVDEDGEWLSDTDGVRELDERTAGKLGVDQRLCDPTGEVCCGTIDLGEILSGESTTTVGSPSTVSVDDDLTASKTSITLWSTNDELSGRLDLLLVSGCIRIEWGI
jgi:hypothetical protein